MIDGGILVHETVLQVNSKSTCAVVARDRLVKMCSSLGEQIPLVLDKYLSPRYTTSTSHLGTRQVPLTSVLDKYLSLLIKFGAKAASIRESSHIYLTRPSGRVGRSS